MQICFGVVRRFLPDKNSYEVTAEMAHNVEIMVPADMLLEFDGSLEQNDEVQLKFSTENDLATIEVHGMTPIQTHSIGLVTKQMDNYVILDQDYTLPRVKIEGTRLIKYMQAVEFEAIKCRDSVTATAYRCVWGKALSLDREKALSVQEEVKRTIEWATDPRLLVRVVEEKAIALVLLGADPVMKTFTVKNISQKCPQVLLNIRVVKDISVEEPCFEVVSPVIEQGSAGLVIPGQSGLTVQVRASGRATGIFEETLVFEFPGNSIMRTLKCVCGDESFIKSYTTDFEPPTEVPSGKELLDSLQLMSKLPSRKRLLADCGIDNPSVNKRQNTRYYDIPHPVRELLLEPNWRWQLKESLSFLFDPLTQSNYAEKLHHSLFVEEMETFRMFDELSRKYRNFTFKQSGKYFVVSMPDLNECRPSPMQYDLVRATSKEPKLVYNGIVVFLSSDEVFLRMETKFQKELAYDLTFFYSRAHFNKQHYSLDQIQSTNRLKSLFPTDSALDSEKAPILDVEVTSDGKLTIRAGGECVKPLDMFRNDLNASQLTVIRNVLRGELRSVPYLIRGPPGTGKTTTLVEIILQLLTHDYKCKILACTQSNSAANLLLMKCVDSQMVRKEEVIRVLAMKKFPEDMLPMRLHDYCARVVEQVDGRDHVEQLAGELLDLDEEARNSNDFVQRIDLETLNSFRLVIVTCGSVGAFSKHEYTHLIMDEAGQCLETEASVAISLMEHPRSQIILAGDDRQLGPVVLCPELAESEFGESLFERLMKLELYDRQSEKCNRVLSNQLNYNYRSVPSILELFNGLFYNHELKAMVASGQKFETLRELQAILPERAATADAPGDTRKEDMGVIFYSVLGTQQRSKSSPSWLNPKEANVVVSLLQKMLSIGTPVDDVGIISPYQGQVRYLRKLCDDRKIERVKIGSVEQFQGQERPVIILTTVRSSEEQFKFAQMSKIGFVNNPKRLNVAISRAQSLLVIVGNSFLLDKDEYWKKTIGYCSTRFSYVTADKELLQVLSVRDMAKMVKDGDEEFTWRDVKEAQKESVKPKTRKQKEIELRNTLPPEQVREIMAEKSAKIKLRKLEKKMRRKERKEREKREQSSATIVIDSDSD